MIATILILIVAITISLHSCEKEEQKREKLVLYSAYSESFTNKIVEIFEAETGIDVEIKTGYIDELISYIRLEGPDPVADVFWGATSSYYFLPVEIPTEFFFRNETIYDSLPTVDLFEYYSSPNLSNNIEGFNTAIKGKITPTSINTSVILINKKNLYKIISTDEKIDGYQSIIDLVKKYPALNGRISYANPNSSIAAYEELVNQLFAFAYVEAEKDLDRAVTQKDITQEHLDRAWTHIAELVAIYNGKHSSGLSGVISNLLYGEMEIVFTDESRFLRNQKNIENNGLADEVVVVYPKEGNLIIPETISIIKGAKNFENAKKFIDYALSLEAQNLIKESKTRPVNKDIDLSDTVLQPLSSFHVIFDHIELEDLNDRKKVLEKYNKLFESE